MTRRTKVLLYTWILSWTAGAPLMFGCYVVLHSYIIRPFLKTAHDLSAHPYFVEFVVASLPAALFAPLVYLCWRTVDNHVARDEDEE